MFLKERQSFRVLRWPACAFIHNHMSSFRTQETKSLEQIKVWLTWSVIHMWRFQTQEINSPEQTKIWLVWPFIYRFCFRTQENYFLQQIMVWIDCAFFRMSNFRTQENYFLQQIMVWLDCAFFRMSNFRTREINFLQQIKIWLDWTSIHISNFWTQEYIPHYRSRSGESDHPFTCLDWGSLDRLSIHLHLYFQNTGIHSLLWIKAWPAETHKKSNQLRCKPVPLQRTHLQVKGRVNKVSNLVFLRPVNQYGYIRARGRATLLESSSEPWRTLPTFLIDN